MTDFEKHPLMFEFRSGQLNQRVEIESKYLSPSILIGTVSGPGGSKLRKSQSWSPCR